jgi:5-carboxymethyl-2-hydroxymuconate isomerase
MPHLTLEYTGNIDQPLDFDELFARLHGVLAEVAAISVDNCKSRAIRLDTYYVGDGLDRGAFVHLTVRFLAGRAPELKQQIGRRCLAVLEAAFAPSLVELGLQITVELQDIERPTYFKIPEGTL